MIEFTGNAKITESIMIFDGLVITRDDPASNRIYLAITDALGEIFITQRQIGNGITLIEGTLAKANK